MKKLLIAAAIVAVSGGVFVGPGQAAPMKDPMCGMAGQGANESWQDHYGCWRGPMVKPVAARPSKKDPMCKMGSQAGSQSWAAYYHCW
jgi:hypothetical protein